MVPAGGPGLWGAYVRFSNYIISGNKAPILRTLDLSYDYNRLPVVWLDISQITLLFRGVGLRARGWR